MRRSPGRPCADRVVAAVADAVDGSANVLVDGGFRRGSDIAKALALGAQAVLIARPVMWGLAAYGADGVQAVVEMLQSELGRVMGCCGTPNLAAIAHAREGACNAGHQCWIRCGGCCRSRRSAPGVDRSTPA